MTPALEALLREAELHAGKCASISRLIAIVRVLEAGCKGVKACCDCEPARNALSAAEEIAGGR